MRWEEMREKPEEMDHKFQQLRGVEGNNLSCIATNFCYPKNLVSILLPLREYIPFSAVFLDFGWKLTSAPE